MPKKSLILLVLVVLSSFLLVKAVCAQERQDVTMSAIINNGLLHGEGISVETTTGAVNVQERKAWKISANIVDQAQFLFESGEIDSLAIEANASSFAVPSVDVIQKTGSTVITDAGCEMRAAGIDAVISIGQIASQVAGSNGSVFIDAQAPLIQGGYIQGTLIEDYVFSVEDEDGEESLTRAHNFQTIRASGNFRGTVEQFIFQSGDPNFPAAPVDNCDDMLKSTLCPWVDPAGGSCLQPINQDPLCIGDLPLPVPAPVEPEPEPEEPGPLG